MSEDYYFVRIAFKLYSKGHGLYIEQFTEHVDYYMKSVGFYNLIVHCECVQCSPNEQV